MTQIQKSENNVRLCLIFLLSLYQEIDLAQDILCHERHSLPADLGELLPIAVHPGQPGSLPIPVEEETSKARRVFLTSSPNEDFFWAVTSISFVIDAGLEKRYVSWFLLASSGSCAETLKILRLKLSCNRFKYIYVI